MEKTIDNHGYCGAVLMDLSKAFDTINHDLLIAKLHRYGVDKRSLSLIRSYLTKREQKLINRLACGPNYLKEFLRGLF